MVCPIVKDGGVMAAVGEQGNHNAPRNGQEDIVDMMIPVNDQASGDEA